PLLEVRRFKTSCEVAGQTVALETAVTLPPNFDPAHPPKAIYRLYPGSRLSEFAETFNGPEIFPARVFCSRGYAVIDSDSPVGPHGEPGEIIKELVKVSGCQLKEAGRLGLVDPEKTAVMGQSKGGYSVLAVCAASDLFRAGVATMGLYDLSHSYVDPNGLGPHYVERHFRTDGPPWADTERYLRNSPFWRAGEIREPIFMAAGSEDKASPAWQSTAMWSALNHHKARAELVVYPGEDHAPRTWSAEHRVDLMERIIDFLDANL
ncbi:MAG: prolyl oligopeptidase family serine peptidase, partial [Candidatus Eremiobacteraeota bacterium]|nr:prolyl oligopeptidase family serine peptidase [Candidatus Eremiobacteraeota bacterium]